MRHGEVLRVSHCAAPMGLMCRQDLHYADAGVRIQNPRHRICNLFQKLLLARTTQLGLRT